MTVPDQLPAGFVPVDLGAGWSQELGQIHVDHANHLYAFRVERRHSNPVGVCHGGAMATFADAQIIAVHAGAATIATHAPTVSLSIDYLAPTPLDAWVIGRVQLVRATRTLIFTQALFEADGTTVVRSNAIYRNGPHTGVTPNG